MTIAQAINTTTQSLSTVSTEPRLEALLLLGHVLNVAKERLPVTDTEQLSPAQFGQLTNLTQRRLQHEPLAYLVGHREFYKLDFIVNQHVLIPRPETELLINPIKQWVLNNKPTAVIADIGTGSGCIAVSLATQLPQATVLATDISAAALTVAKANAKKHGVENRVQFLQGSLVLPIQDKELTVVVANLPYIPSNQLATLSPNVVNYEPTGALDGGNDGFALYRKLFIQLRKTTVQLIAIEIDPTQLEQAQRLISDYWPYRSILTMKDLQGRNRVLVADLRY